MKIHSKHKHFIECVLSFICLGLGQRFLISGLIKPWAEDRKLLVVLSLIGGLLFVLGGILFIKLFLWFYKKYNQNNRILKVLIYTIGATLVCGIVVGLLGQLLYDNSAISYRHIKTGIWVVSSYIQTAIKLIGLYALMCFYRGNRFSWKDRPLKQIILVGLGMVTGMAILSFLLPNLVTPIQYLVDTTLILGVIYCFIAKENKII